MPHKHGQDKADENDFLVFERKILRRIYGPVKDREDWRRCRNGELYTLYNDLTILDFIKNRISSVDILI